MIVVRKRYVGISGRASGRQMHIQVGKDEARNGVCRFAEPVGGLPAVQSRLKNKGGVDIF